MLLVWSDRLSVGHAAIDDDHKILIGIINQLDAAVRDGRGSDVIGGTLSELADYAAYHFGREEWLMDSRRYPNADQHREAHVDLIGRLAELIGDYEQGKDSVSQDTLEFLKTWFFDHTGSQDLDLASYINGLNPAG